LTLAQFDALAERYQDSKEWEDHRAALICAVVANCHRGKKSKAYKPSDFMPKKKAIQTPQQMKSTLLMTAKGMEKKYGKRAK